MKKVRHPRINTTAPDGIINWKSSAWEIDTIHAIVQRFEKEYKAAVKSSKMPVGYDRMSLTMDIKACHLNGMTLDLARLLAFPTFDFFHDVNGISLHINRKTGKIEDHFVPRSAS